MNELFKTPETLGGRIAWARAQRGMTQAQLAAAAGVSQSSIASYESGDRAQPRNVFRLAYALEVNAIWLQDGQGEWAPPGKFMPEHLRGPVEQQGADPGLVRFAVGGQVLDGQRSRYVSEPAVSYGLTPILAWEHEDDLPPGEYVMVPRLDVQLSAGGGRDQVEIELTKDMPQAFRTEWIRLQKLKPNKLAAMRASGDSMETTIFDADSLLVDTSQTSVVDGKVYALWYDGGERVKRLFRLPGGGLRIKSDNPRYDPIELSPDYVGDVRIIGRVVHRSGIGGL